MSNITSSRFSGGVRREQSANSEVRFATQLVGDHRISSLLNAIVDEPVRAPQVFDQFLMHGWPQRCVDLLPGSPEHDRECREVGAVSRIRELLQRSPCALPAGG